MMHFAMTLGAVVFTEALRCIWILSDLVHVNVSDI